MVRLFERHPEAVRAHRRDRAALHAFRSTNLRYQYPAETEEGETAQEKLERLTWEGAKSRYPDGVPDKVATQLRHELRLIEEPANTRHTSSPSTPS